MRRYKYLFLLLTLPGLILHAQPRLALLIGNAQYTHSGTLRNPVNDVRAMQKVLSNVGFTVYTLVNGDQNQMKQAIDEFGQRLSSNSVGLLYYSGHGVQAKGLNYLIPVDAVLKNESDAEYECVRADRILAKMESASSRVNILILDACRNNPFERTWRRAGSGKGLAIMEAPSGSYIAYSTAPGKTALDGTGSNLSLIHI